MPVLRRYIRIGECNRCGDCCLNEDCDHLQFLEDGMTACAIFDSPDRPLRCKLYPEMPPIVFNRCSFKFLDTYEDNRVVGPGQV